MGTGSTIALIKALGGNSGGGSSDVIFVHEGDEGLDHTWSEIYNAIASGKVVILGYEDGGECAVISLITAAAYVNEKYAVYTNFNFPGSVVPNYWCDNSDEHPSYHNQEENEGSSSGVVDEDPESLEPDPNDK